MGLRARWEGGRGKRTASGRSGDFPIGGEVDSDQIERERDLGD